MLKRRGDAIGDIRVKKGMSDDDGDMDVYTEL